MRRSTIWSTAIVLCLPCFIAIAHSQICNNATSTLRGWQDIVALAPCTTFTGSLAIATDFDSPLLEVEGPETIVGSVVIQNVSNITTIAARNLTTVTEDCVLSNLPLLTNLTLPNWSSVSTLRLDRIPTPNTLNLQTTFQQVTNLYVTNTTLEALPALVLPSAQMENLVVTGNEYLNTVRFEAGNITQTVHIADNGGTMALTLPNLTYAYDMAISNASQISLPLLSSVSQNLLIAWNSASNVSLPELSYVGSKLGIANNSQLDNVQFRQLVNVQGELDVTGNPQIEQVDGFPALSYVGDRLTLDGQFTSITFPSLRAVGGDVKLESTADTFNCSAIPSGIVTGKYTCDAEDAAPNRTGATSQHKSHTLRGGAIAGIAIGAVAGLAVLVLLVISCFRRHTLLPPELAPPNTHQSDSKHHSAELPSHASDGMPQTAQLRAPTPVVELPASRSPPLTRTPPPPMVPQRSARRPRSASSNQRFTPSGSGSGSGSGYGSPGGGGGGGGVPSPVTPVTGVERWRG